MTAEQFAGLATEYNLRIGSMSFSHMFRRTEPYKQLVTAGAAIVPHIIAGFRAYRDAGFPDRVVPEEIWGMAWVTVLMDVTGTTPLQPEPVAGGGFVAWDVDAAGLAWIKWYDDGGMMPCPCGCGADSSGHCWNDSKWGGA